MRTRRIEWETIGEVEERIKLTGGHAVYPICAECGGRCKHTYPTRKEKGGVRYGVCGECRKTIEETRFREEMERRMRQGTVWEMEFDYPPFEE